MVAWFNSLTQLQSIFAYIAVPATLLLILQTILLLFGLYGNDGDADYDNLDYEGEHDFDGDGDIDSDNDIVDHGLRLFTVRGLVAFFSIMGWTGIVLSKNNVNDVISVIIAIIAGAIAMFFTAFVIKMAVRLQSDGTMDIKNTLGVSGTVYLPIPPERKDKGKVNLVLQGQFGEFDAVTDEKTPLPYGTEITVIGVSGMNRFTGASPRKVCE